METRVKKICNYILGAVFTALGLLLLLGVAYFAWQNDDLTQMQVLKYMWLNLLLGNIFLIVGLCIYDYFGLRKSKR